jgi:pyruvate,water dikinase
MSSVRFFGEIGELDGLLVGGKASTLARLLAAGFPVPEGFCVTSSALEETARADKTIPGRMAMEILDARRQLAAETLAVRSSAVFEDAESASFAGQLETILGVRGDEELLAAIMRCWEAGHSARVAAYRRKRDWLPMPQVVGEGVAVIVQSLVEADAAGVLFTVDIRSGRLDHMVIESAWGLGESVVSGKVNPDRFVLDKSGRSEEHTSELQSLI